MPETLERHLVTPVSKSFHENLAVKNPRIVPLSLSLIAPLASAPDLTIHRRTFSHHGRALKVLGRAAEYLVHSRIYKQECNQGGEREAVGVLMRLSREVFEEYAGLNTQSHPVTDWLMSRAVQVYGSPRA